MADSSTLSVEHVPETSSTRMTEIITGTFDFEVTNYRQLRGMAVNEFISSRDFRVGGYDWRIKFYPSGATDSAGSASAYVQLASQGKDASAKFTLSVLGKDGEAPPVVSHRGDRVFSPGVEDNWGSLQFVAKSKLKSLSRHCRGGCFTIRCVLAVRNESSPLELFDHLERMLRDGTCADITFVVDGREFHAHKCILAARSPVFRAQFLGPMMEKDMPRVQIVDMDAAIFEMMLHYIYTGSISPCSSDNDDADVMQHLLVAADRYGVEKLKMICEEELCKRMDVESVMSRFMLAKQRSCNRLKDACLEFMSSSPEVLGVVLENLSISIKDN